MFPAKYFRTLNENGGVLFRLVCLQRLATSATHCPDAVHSTLSPLINIATHTSHSAVMKPMFLQTVCRFPRDFESKQGCIPKRDPKEM